MPSPLPAPGLPHLPQIVLIVGPDYDQVERITKFVSTPSGGRYWIASTTGQVGLVKMRLLAICAKCGRDTRLDSCCPGYIDKGPARILQFRD